jgi:cation diffusion facilitator CzcD-associated flavoprotein CzcO
MSTDASHPTRKTVAIIGAGISGIIQGAEIHRKRVLSNPEQELVIFEKAAGFGGVWFANTYPGAACDIVSHIYSISWFPKYSMWGAGTHLVERC